MHDHKTCQPIVQSATVPPELAGERLDKTLARCFPDFSRAQLQKWLKEGAILVDGRTRRAREKLGGGEQLALNAWQENHHEWPAQALALDIIYEDDHVIVVNKPAGVVVHPGAGNRDHTLSNGLLYHCETMRNVPRCGIVHRLDKDTSGLLVAAKTLKAHHSLVDQLQQRRVKREYDALASGYITAGGRIDAPIGRSPHQRTRMAVTEMGKPAVTHFNVLERYRYHTRIRCRLETGRTHQIRVHMAHIHAPLLGDPLYQRRLKLYGDMSTPLREALRATRTQALHARKLSFIHPHSGETLRFDAPIPGAMQQLIDILREDAQPLYNRDSEGSDDDPDWHDPQW